MLTTKTYDLFKLNNPVPVDSKGNPIAEGSQATQSSSSSSSENEASSSGSAFLERDSRTSKLPESRFRSPRTSNYASLEPRLRQAQSGSGSGAESNEPSVPTSEVNNGNKPNEDRKLVAKTTLRYFINRSV